VFIVAVYFDSVRKLLDIPSYRVPDITWFLRNVGPIYRDT